LDPALRVHAPRGLVGFALRIGTWACRTAARAGEDGKGRAMKVLVFGAGVIGQIYGGRLLRSGHDVTLLARGRTAELLAARGITLRRGDEHWQVRPPVVGVGGITQDDLFDVVLVTVRLDQVDEVVPELARVPATRVALLLARCIGLERLREQVGADRTVFAFPGVGGQRLEDGTISYLQVAQQKTTVERRDGLEQPVVDLLRSAGFPVAVSGHMAGWLKTHAVFVGAVSAAIHACGGDSVALAADRGRVAEFVAAVDEGFQALARQGVPVTPTPLRLIFTVVPRFVAPTGRSNFAGQSVRWRSHHTSRPAAGLSFRR
jgi:2-dehydropantoate 2-reductase